VTGPAWAGMLPPRAGWRRITEISGRTTRAVAAELVAEFRARTEELPPERRTRAELDTLAEELWARPLRVPAGERTAGQVPLRAVHAAYALGFLREPPGADDPVVVLSTAGWVRLRTGYGSVAVRERPAVPALALFPTTTKAVRMPKPTPSPTSRASSAAPAASTSPRPSLP